MSTIEKAAYNHKIFFLIYIIFVLGTVVLSIFVWITSNKYQDAVKADADSKIESAKKDAAVANAQAEEARIISLKMEKEVAEAKRQQLEAERSLLDLKSRMRDRHISAAQKTLLLDLLKDIPTPQRGFTILKCSSDFDPEVLAFTNEIDSLLGTAGWELTKQMPYKSMLKPMVEGLIIYVRSPSAQAMTIANPLKEAFSKAGIDVKLELMSDYDEKTVLLMVGKKPSTY